MPLRYENALPEDAEALVALRIEAMRPSLEHLGRFDPQRAGDRFLSHFLPELTRHLLWAGQRVGFVVLRPTAQALSLDHLYLRPGHQGLGIGAAVLAEVFAQADAQQQPIEVMALRESRANAFYQRHGFVWVRSSEWDHHYRRPVAASAVAAPPVLAPGARRT